MTEIPFLSKHDYERHRAAQELAAWIDFVDCKFAETEDSKWIANFGQGLAKKYFEEARPTASFIRASYIGRKDVTVQMMLGNQQYDAVLRFADAVEPRQHRIECVAAIDGDEEHSRMQFMKKHGHVSLTGPVSKSGTKNKGYEIDIPSVSKPVCQTNAECMELIERAIRRKAAKNYQDFIWLLVSFDDGLLVPRGRTLPKLREMTRAIVCTSRTKFGRVIVIGSSGKIYLDWETGS